MSGFYGLEDGELPAFVGTAGSFIAFDELPDETQVFIAAILELMRGLHDENPIAFEAVIGFLASQADAVRLRGRHSDR